MTPWDNSSIGYTGDDVLRMQQEAIKRVKEMQKRADYSLNQSNNSSFTVPPQNLNEQFTKPINQNTNNNINQSAEFANKNFDNQSTGFSPPKQNNSTNNFLHNLLNGGLSQSTQSLTDIPKKAFSSITSILEGFGIDNEKLILIVLIYLLANEGEDKTLLLALGYLLF
ncbi:MAG: hypothetical protein RSD67_00010 [Oscillospiraceae bacterium]